MKVEDSLGLNLVLLAQVLQRSVPTHTQLDPESKISGNDFFYDPIKIFE